MAVAVPKTTLHSLRIAVHPLRACHHEVAFPPSWLRRQQRRPLVRRPLRIQHIAWLVAQSTGHVVRGIRMWHFFKPFVIGMIVGNTAILFLLLIIFPTNEVVVIE